MALHTAFLVSCAAEALAFPARPPAVALSAVGGAIVAQALRWWAVASLRGRWTTRIVVRPGAAPETGGPYRWLAHPNYLAVAVELLAVPLVGGAVLTAAAATLGNAALLAVRIPAEERALGEGWARAFGRKLVRFIPDSRWTRCFTIIR